MRTIPRRQFTLASTLGLLACGRSETRTETAPGPGPSASVAAGSLDAGGLDAAASPEGITAAAFAEADKLQGVRTPVAFRERFVADWPASLRALHERRRAPLANGDAPATSFDPRVGLAPRSRAAGPPSSAGAAVVATDPGPVPTEPEALAFAPVTALGFWLRRRALTATRLMDVYIERLKRIGPRLECVITLTEELARSQAAAADAEITRGRYRGPLHGIPWGAKDLLDTAGIPTTWGVAPYKDRRPTSDAVVVKRLADAGAVLVAKLSLGELANGDIWFGGRTRNPWNLAEGSSGSSSGPGAAVAAGLVGFAIGSETMGSILAPSGRCGTAGLRPTFGRVPRTGAMALAWSLDKLGPMARTVDDTYLVLAAIAGADAGDPTSRTEPLVRPRLSDLRGLKVGYAAEWRDANPVDKRAFDVLAELGAELVTVELPDLPYDAFEAILLAEAGAAFEAFTLEGGLDALRVQEHKECRPALMRRARYVSAVDLLQADRHRRRAMALADTLFQKVDVLAGPCLDGKMLTLTNMTGHPCVVVRAGFEEAAARGFDLEPPRAGEPRPTARVPRGLSLWGRLFDEGRLCAVAALLEGRLGAAGERPPSLG